MDAPVDKNKLTKLESIIMNELTRGPKTGEQLMKAMFPDARVFSRKTLSMHMSNIRIKLDMINSTHDIIYSRRLGTYHLLDLSHETEDLQ